MFNVEGALAEKFDVVVAALKELNESEKIIGQQELTVLLFKAYELILPAPAKIFVKPHAFVNACLKRQDEFLKEINKDVRKKMFAIV